MAGTIVKKNAVKRKPGHLYFVDGQGNVRETKMKRGGGKKKKAAPKKKKAAAKKRAKKSTRSRKRK